MNQKRKSKKSHSVRTVQVGTETFMNTQTGELVDMPRLLIKGGDINFEKVWIWHLCEAYELIGNKAVEVLNYLVEHRDQNNLVISTQRKIADDIGIGVATVTRVLTKLKGSNLISMPQQGVYRINPDMMWRGDHRARLQVLYEYRSEKAQELPDKAVEPNIEDKMIELNKRSEMLLKEVAKIHQEMRKLTSGEPDQENEAAE